MPKTIKVCFTVRQDGFLQMRFSEDISVRPCPVVFRAGESYRFKSDLDSQFLVELVTSLVDPDPAFYIGIDEVHLATSKVVKVRYDPKRLSRRVVNNLIKETFLDTKAHGFSIKVVRSVDALKRKG
jgi:hypothetical protein